MGFTVAQDRLPQLVWFKLLSQGRLSEVLGLWEPLKRIDLLMRGFELHQVGKRMLELASPEAKQAFREYYAGVNLFLERQSVLPIELELLQLSGNEIEPFAEDDLVGVAPPARRAPGSVRGGWPGPGAKFCKFRVLLRFKSWVFGCVLGRSRIHLRPGRRRG